MRRPFGPDRPLRKNLKGWPKVPSDPEVQSLKAWTAYWSFVVFIIFPKHSKSEVTLVSSNENIRRVSCEWLASFGLASVWLAVSCDWVALGWACLHANAFS